jgi:hypothetical protein
MGGAPASQKPRMGVDRQCRRRAVTELLTNRPCRPSRRKGFGLRRSRHDLARPFARPSLLPQAVEAVGLWISHARPWLAARAAPRVHVTATHASAIALTLGVVTRGCKEGELT